MFYKKLLISIYILVTAISCGWAQEQAEVLPEPQVSSLESKIFKLQYVRPQMIADKVRELMGSASGGVIVNEQSQEIEISSPPEMMEKIASLISELDKARDLDLEIKIVQVDLSEEHLPGINWSAIVSNYKSFTVKSDKRKYSTGTVSVEDLPVLLEALETVGETKIYPVYRTQITGSKDMDLRLKAFGRDVSVNVSAVTQDNILDPEPQDRYTARLLFTTNSDGKENIDLHIVSEDEASSTLTIGKNDVAVIGGIFTQTKSESTKKFPFLGDVPLLGIVFRDQSTVTQRLENIIIITPRVKLSVNPTTQP